MLVQNLAPGAISRLGLSSELLAAKFPCRKRSTTFSSNSLSRWRGRRGSAIRARPRRRLARNYAPAISEDPFLHRYSQGRGRQMRAGRRTGDQGRGRRQVFRQAHHLYRPRQQDAHCPGGGLRPGAFRHQVQGRGGRGTHRHDIAYGLGAGGWTRSLRRAHTTARRIKPAPSG